MPRGGLYEKNPHAWFALRARLHAAGKWYGDQQRTETAEGEPPEQVERTEHHTDVHTTIPPTAVTGTFDLDQICLQDFFEDPDWGISPTEYISDNTTNRTETLPPTLFTNMSIINVGPNDIPSRQVRDGSEIHRPNSAATRQLLGAKSLTVTVRNEAANTNSIYGLCPPCNFVHKWPLNVYDTTISDESGECPDCSIYHQLSGAHHIYYTKQRNVTVDNGDNNDSDVQRNIRLHQEKMACMGLYSKSNDGVAHLLWLDESKFSDINEQEYSSILSRFQFYTSYALICAAQKKPFENMETGCCNVDLAMNVFNTFMTVLKPEWAFSTWENSKDNVLHLHLCFQHTGRIDTAKKKLLNLPQYDDATLTTVKLERTRSFQNLFRYYMKDPIVVMSTDMALLNASLYALNNGLGWVDGIKKPTPIADVVLEIMQRHKVNTIPEMMEHEPDMMWSLLQTPNLQTIIDNCRTFIAATQPKKSLLAAVSAMQKPDPRRVHNVLVTQHIDVETFDNDFFSWLTKGHPKKNTMILYGPSNTGKSCFIRPFMSLYRFGEITNSNSFMYQNCIDKDLILWEEPLIGNSELEKFKLVSEGSPTEVSIKFRAPEKLERTPLLITTNHHIWRFCSSEESALRNRCYIHTFGHVFRNDSDRSCQSNRCFCRHCQDSGNRVESTGTIGSGKHSTSSSSDVGGNESQHRSRGGGSGPSTPGRCDISSTDRVDDGWIVVDNTAEPTTGDNDNGRGASNGCSNQFVIDGAGSTVSCGGSAVSHDTRSDPSDGSSHPLGERATGEQGTTERFRIPLRRGDVTRHNKQHRLQETDTTSASKRQRIAGRVVDAFGNDIGEFTGTSIVTQEIPITTTKHLQILPTESDIDITSEFLVEQPVPDELNSVDWKCYIAHIRAKFLHE